MGEYALVVRIGSSHPIAELAPGAQANENGGRERPGAEVRGIPGRNPQGQGRKTPDGLRELGQPASRAEPGVMGNSRNGVAQQHPL
jgi:hypothetical protein